MCFPDDLSVFTPRTLQSAKDTERTLTLRKLYFEFLGIPLVVFVEVLAYFFSPLVSLFVFWNIEDLQFFSFILSLCLFLLAVAPSPLSPPSLASLPLPAVCPQVVRTS